MNSCKNCANAVYDERMGQYRCKVYQHRIRDVDRYLDCEDHEPKNKQRKKRERDE